jgi:hypothetical protein
MFSKTLMYGGGFFASEGLGGPIGLVGRGRPWRQITGHYAATFFAPARFYRADGRPTPRPGPGRGDECPPGEPRTD